MNRGATSPEALELSAFVGAGMVGAGVVGAGVVGAGVVGAGMVGAGVVGLKATVLEHGTSTLTPLHDLTPDPR